VCVYVVVGCVYVGGVCVCVCGDGGGGVSVSVCVCDVWYVGWRQQQSHRCFQRPGPFCTSHIE